MSTLDTSVLCPECDCERRALFDNKAPPGEEYTLHPCDNARCSESESDRVDLQIERVELAVNELDFTIGDSFWIGPYEFTVTNARAK